MADGIVHEPVPGGTWLALPPRVVPRGAAWGMVAVGLAITAFMVFWMHGAGGGWRFRSAGDLIPLVFAALGLPGLLIGLGVVLLGIGLLRGASRCRVGLVREDVLVREELWWLHWTRRTPRRGLRGLLVREAEPVRTALLLRRDGAADLRCAAGYPAAQLHALAAALDGLLGGIAVADPAQAPPPGNLEVEEAGGRLAIALARPGAWLPLAIFILFWLGVTAVFTATGLGLLGKPLSWGLLAFTLPFWAIGIGLALLAVHSATHRVALLWDGTQLTLVDRSALRRRVRTWRPAELAAVLSVERGSGSGRYRVVELRQRDGGEHSIALGLDEEAQEWIAARLRRALGL